MTVGVFSGCIEFVLMVCMFDRANLQATFAKFDDQIAYECGLTVVFSADDVDTSHDLMTCDDYACQARIQARGFGKRCVIL